MPPPAASRGASEPAELAGSVRDGALVLVVDDDKTNRLVLQALLQRTGFSYVAANDGLEAVEAYTRYRPDIVLMDLMMPNMDGREAACRIKAEAGDDHVPILFLTGMTDEQELAECIEAGGDDIVSKPYSPLLLKAKLQAALRMRLLYQLMKRNRDSLERLRSQHEEDLRVARNIYATHARQQDYVKLKNVRYLIDSMEVLNGDVVLAATTPAGGQMFMLGDFTGHGLPAAVGAMVVFDIFYAMSAKGFALPEVVREINRKLRVTLPVGRFMAAAAVELNPAGDQAAIWNGGLPELLHWSPEVGLKDRIASQHLPLGIVDDEQLELAVSHIALHRGDELIMYSDGFIEADDGFGEMLGTRRLIERVQGAAADGDVFERLTGLLTGHRGGAPLKDDVSLMVVRAERRGVGDSPDDAPAVFGKAPMDWRCSLELGASALRECDPLPSLLQAVDAVQGLGGMRARLFTILAELFSNALEHGLLGIDSALKHSPEGFSEYYAERSTRLERMANGRMRFDIRHVPSDAGYELVIRLEHDGSGFDPGAVLQELDEHRAFSGRGIQLVRSLSDSIRYGDDGRCVEVRLNTSKPPLTGDG